jgi:hypothetical protein
MNNKNVSPLGVWLRDFVHNVIVHPLMMVLPRDIANEMHDLNANWAFGLERYDELTLEGVRQPEPVDGFGAHVTHGVLGEINGRVIGPGHVVLSEERYQWLLKAAGGRNQSGETRDTTINTQTVIQRLKDVAKPDFYRIRGVVPNTGEVVWVTFVQPGDYFTFESSDTAFPAQFASTENAVFFFNEEFGVTGFSHADGDIEEVVMLDNKDNIVMRLGPDWTKAEEAHDE